MKRALYLKVPLDVGFLASRKERFELEDNEHSGQLVEFDEERLNQLLHESPRQTTRKLEELLDCDHKTVLNHLHSTGKVQKLSLWLPHTLNEHNKNQCITISASWLAQHCSTYGHK